MFGSGAPVAPGLILTVYHVACPAGDKEPVTVRDKIGRTAEATIVWADAELDAVLLQTDRAVLGAGLTVARWGELTCDYPDARPVCSMTGFPWAMRRQTKRLEVGAGGGHQAEQAAVPAVGGDPGPLVDGNGNGNGNPTVTAHRFRHTVGTQLAEGAAQIQTIMAILGHCNAQMSATYFHISNPVLKEQYEKVIAADGGSRARRPRNC